MAAAPIPALPAKYPTTQLLASEFVICAGCILFRHVPNYVPPPTTNGTNGAVTTPPKLPLQVCLLRHPLREEWLLPKGRKDRGESLEQTALRETFEETGFPPALLPVGMHTRAPDPTINLKDGPPGVFVAQCTEPFAGTARIVGPRNTKFTWWFTAIVDEAARWPRDADGEVARVEGTMTDSECFESEWVDADGPAGGAEGRLTFENDRELVRQAVELVRETYGA